MHTVAHIGAFTISNYGDQLYPSLLDSFLAHEQIEVHVNHYALQTGELTDGRIVHDLARARRDHKDIVFVGGGDLIRCDRYAVALDHLDVGSAERSSIKARIRARLFAARYLGDGMGPWLPRSGWGATTAWISVGVHDLPPGLGSGALTSVRSAWVRTLVGRERLIAAGMDGARCNVAPDAAFALAEFIDVERFRRRGRAVLESTTGFSDGVVVLQAAGFHGWDIGRVARLVDSFGNVPVALLPLGRYAGEHELLRKAARVSGAVFLGLLPVDDVTAILSAAGCVVTTSLHAAFVASTLGRPAIVPNVEKTATALLACPEPPRILSKDDTEIPSAAAELRVIDSLLPSGENAAAVLEAFHRTLEQILD